MYSAKERMKQLAQQQLSNTVHSNKVFENYQKDMMKIEANSYTKSLSRVQKRQKEEVLAEMERQAAVEKERVRKEEEKRQQKLAAEFYELNRQKIVEEKLRQQIRESNHELKELESRLRAAYVAKGLAAQRQEKEALKLQEKIYIQNEQAEMERTRVEVETEMRKRMEVEAEKKKQIREALREQIMSGYLRNQYLYEEFLKEKRYLDEIIKRIQDEQIEETRQKMLRKERTRQDMEEFQRQKKIWQEQQNLEIEEENERIKEYCLEMEKKRLEAEAEKQRLAVERDKQNEKMVHDLTKIIEENERREQLLLDLYEIEKDERDLEIFRKQLEEKVRKRIEARIALDMQRANNQLKADMEAEENRKFAEEQMKFLAEKDKLDQLSNERRRRKQLEHKQAIRELIEKRKVERAEQTARMVKSYEDELREEENRQKIIEEERLKLLKEHANDLIGFLPNGILKELSKE